MKDNMQSSDYQSPKPMAQNTIQDLINSNSCGTCKARRLPVCVGHGGSGSGTEGSGSDNSSDNTNTFQRSPEITFNPETLAELTAKNILTIKYEDFGRLTIQSNPTLLQPEQTYQLNYLILMIEALLKDFKETHALNNNACHIQLKKDEQGNRVSIVISINNPRYYDLFIEKLNQFQLLSMLDKNVAQSKNANSPISINTLKTPYSTKPKPKGFE